MLFIEYSEKLEEKRKTFQKILILFFNFLSRTRIIVSITSVIFGVFERHFKYLHLPNDNFITKFTMNSKKNSIFAMLLGLCKQIFLNTQQISMFVHQKKNKRRWVRLLKNIWNLNWKVWKKLLFSRLKNDKKNKNSKAASETKQKLTNFS